MFVRFVVAERDPDSGHERGVFSALYDLEKRGELLPPELSWFREWMRTLKQPHTSRTRPGPRSSAVSASPRSASNLALNHASVSPSAHVAAISFDFFNTLAPHRTGRGRGTLLMGRKPLGLALKLAVDPPQNQPLQLSGAMSKVAIAVHLLGVQRQGALSRAFKFNRLQLSAAFCGRHALSYFTSALQQVRRSPDSVLPCSGERAALDNDAPQLNGTASGRHPSDARRDARHHRLST